MLESDNDLMFEIDREPERYTIEEAELAARILSSIPEIDFAFKRPGPRNLSPYIIGLNPRYSVQFQHPIGLVVIRDRQDPTNPDFVYNYSSISGLVGWVLSRIGVGNNPGNFEGFSMMMEDVRSHILRGPPSVYFAFEDEIPRQKQEEYRRIEESLKQSSLSGVDQGGQFDPEKLTEDIESSRWEEYSGSDISDIFSLEEDEEKERGSIFDLFFGGSDD